MSTPVLFIAFPLLAAIGLLFLRKRTNLVLILSLSLYGILGLLSFVQNFGEVMKIGPLSIEISTSLNILGRSLELANRDRFFLVIVSLFMIFWLGGVKTSGVGINVIPYQMMVTSFLVSALAVEPFLYSAIFIEIGGICALPVLISSGKPLGKGVLRFLIFQSLSMPLILLGGWLLAGSQASPSDIQQLAIAGLFLGIGFAFWLAVFPFHSWVPQLSEDAHPYLAGFLLTMFPQVAIMVILDFVSGVTWIRESIYFGLIFLSIGSIMIFATAIWAVFEHNIQRLFGLVVLFETGSLLVLVSMKSTFALETLYLTLIPRFLTLALASLCISILLRTNQEREPVNLEGCLRNYPFASGGLVLSFFSIIGLPLLAEFPYKLILWNVLGSTHPTLLLWFLISFIAMLLPIFRFLLNSLKSEATGLLINESRLQILLICTGIFLLFLMGIFPSILNGIFTPLIQLIPVIS